jgi:tRNA(Ile)-lysidine synthase
VKALEGSVEGALAEAGVAPYESLLVGFSAGPDSTALLHAIAVLRELRSTVPRGVARDLSACYVDHGIRPSGEIAEDIAFALRVCESLGIRLLVTRIPEGECASRAGSTGRSLEEIAREMRHRLLRQAARDAGASAIALGHTQDDVVETLLMRVLQGSDAEGLAGIPLRRGPFVRPLLACRRSDVMEYLAICGQGWREDPTNRDTTFMRNRVRHLLVPLLEERFPGYRKGLLALSGKQSLVADMVRGMSEALPWTSEKTGFSIAPDDFYGAQPPVRARSLLHLYDRFRSPESPRRLPWRFLLPALGDRQPRENRKEMRQERNWVIRGHGAAMALHNGRLVWGPDIASRGKIGYFMEVADAGTFPIRKAGMRLTTVRMAGAASGGHEEVFILASAVELPLVLRSKRKGDEILLEDGATPVKNLMAGWKVSSADRDRIPILADRKGVVAVLGGALGYRSLVRAGATAGSRDDASRIAVRVESDVESDMVEGT